MAGDIGEDGERAGDHDSRHDGEPVQAIGQVHRIAAADDDEIGQHDEADGAQRQRQILEERHDEFGLGRHRRRIEQVDGDAEADQRLPEIFLARRQAFRVAVHDLAPVIDPADDAEAQRRHQHHPDESVAEVCPQQRGDGDGDQDQRAAHGRRAGLDQMRLRTVVTHGLADLVLGQLANQARADDEGDDERRQRRQHCAQRDVVEDIECAYVLRQPLCELKQHRTLPPDCFQ